jgi:hypothetical protein
MGIKEQGELLLMKARLLAFQHRMTTLQTELYNTPTREAYSMLANVHIQWQNFKLTISKRLKELEEMVEMEKWMNEVIFELSRNSIDLILTKD